MLKKLLLAATAAATVIAGAPLAHATTVQADCGFETFSQAEVTGTDTYTGAAYGYAVFDDTNEHTLRCYISVDGVEEVSTPTRSGNGLLATAGQVTFTAPPDATIQTCVVIDGQTYACASASTPMIPPPGVICVAGTGCEGSNALICVAGTGCNNDDNALVCIAGTGCNDGSAVVCVANIGCNNEGAPVCIAVDGCNTALLSLKSLLTDFVDPSLCPILASLAPGVPGVVDIDSTGDVYVGGVFVYDCPPYAVQ